MNRDKKEHTCVFGLGWGDEGKGKVVDLLCSAFDVVVRYNGGANAGHTVCVGDETFALHLLPAGVLHDNVTSVIGPGVVVDPSTLLKEIDDLAARGINVAARLRISDRAHLVLAYHKLEDQLGERSPSRGVLIGTTARGIGPCYADKMKRTTAVRVGDLLHDDHLAERVRRLVADRRASFVASYGEDGGLDEDAVIDELQTARARLGPFICDTTEFLHQAINAGQVLLFEGANGMLLDVDHGTYPFVTSSSTGPYGIGAGAGVPPSRVTRLIGTVKAYATRVGSGPFVTELDNDIGNRIRERGREFGTTTGRPRRCGWFDTVSCRYAARLTGVTSLALLHLDTLTGFDRVGLCVAYRLEGRTLMSPPADACLLERVEPVIEFLPGWHEDLRSLRRYDDLPSTARDYLERIETLVGAPVLVVGVGPERSQVLLRGGIRDLVRVPEPATT
jgi:adenylosuccinate synthase